MPIKFTFVDEVIQASPKSRFPQARVTSGQEFRWHRFALPGPAYRLCLVKMTAIVNDDQITVQCFDHDGKLVGSPFDVTLTDWNQAWPTFPSTIQWDRNPPPHTPKMPALDNDNCAVLCLSEALLTKNGVLAVGFDKYPYAEDAETATRAENAKLRAALNELRASVQPNVFEGALGHNNIDAATLRFVA